MCVCTRFRPFCLVVMFCYGFLYFYGVPVVVMLKSRDVVW